MNKEKKAKTKFYTIKMPVYTTSSFEDIKGLFGNVTYQEMIDYLVAKINNFKGNIQTQNKNKTFINVIDSIKKTEVSIGDIPALLLQISSYKTNMYGGYFQSDKKIDIQKENRIGNNSNYVLLYPKISGVSERTRSCYFLMVVYEDPTKETGVVSKLAKEVAKKILKTPVQNIKMPIVLKELKRIGIIPELSVTYFTIEPSDSNVGEAYRKYICKTQLKSEDQRDFKEMPYDTVEKLLKDVQEDKKYKKKRTIIHVGKTEYQIENKNIAEACEELNETAEKIFNGSVEITQDELDNKIYDNNFIVEKMCSVLKNYESID